MTFRQATTALLAAFTLILAVGLIGVFEGAYNHAMKQLLFFGGADLATSRTDADGAASAPC